MPNPSKKPGDRRVSQRRKQGYFAIPIRYINNAKHGLYKRTRTDLPDGIQITTSTRVNDRRSGVSDRRTGLVDRRSSKDRRKQTVTSFDTAAFLASPLSKRRGIYPIEFKDGRKALLRIRSDGKGVLWDNVFDVAQLLSSKDWNDTVSTIRFTNHRASKNRRQTKRRATDN